ncbi:hypothetical protein [Caulobacter soli]|uniref:hypothetical protein n=1 Tax=Caulobacter soli TaxID=2708539 RepID=UPI0013EC6C9F|nr:hypothetical protein [Caulobacter soli]
MSANRARPGPATAALIATCALLSAGPVDAAARVDPGSLPAVGKVDRRFQSYNVEMAEVIGGRFWAPYPKPGEKAPTIDLQKSGGVEIANVMFRQRAPIDLRGDRRLRNLAKGLGPAYVRVSGGWANNVYFHDADTTPPAEPPKGYQGVLTRSQWSGVLDFVRATDSKLVTSFAIGPAARDPDGVWNPDQARRLIAYTRAQGGRIDAAELINEPNVGAMVGLPPGYDAAAYARDMAVFKTLVRTQAPDLKIVGPGSTGEAGFIIFPQRGGMISSQALMSAEPRTPVDVFSYHFYGTVSARCRAIDKNAGVAPDQALSEAWLARADQVFDYYKALRDQYAPGAPIWVTEMGQAGCGGDQWAATWLDTFRYVDQMGRLAKRGVAAIFHNTLAASDYALIDDASGQPRPSYWAALLWGRLMGEVVLDAGPARPGLHVYAHCLRDKPGGVGLVAINLDTAAPATLELPTAGRRYTLTADTPQASKVKLNGRELDLPPGDQLPKLKGQASGKGALDLPPASITFIAVPNAANPACRAT